MTESAVIDKNKKSNLFTRPVEEEPNPSIGKVADGDVPARGTTRHVFTYTARMLLEL